MRIFTLAVLAALVSFSSFGQIWEKAYGDTTINESFRGMTLTADSGLVVAGVVLDASTSAYDITLSRYDLNGDTIWTTILPTSGSDVSSCVAEDPITGDLFLGGMTRTYGGADDDWYIAKFNSVGTMMWDSTFNGTSSHDEMRELRVKNGFLYAVGIVSDFPGSKGYVRKMNLDGVKVWDWEINSPGNDEEIRDIQINNSDELFVCGKWAGDVQSQWYVGKISSSGATQWEVKLNYGTDCCCLGSGGSFGEKALAEQLAISPAGNIFVTGFNYPDGPGGMGSASWCGSWGVACIDPAGNLLSKNAVDNDYNPEEIEAMIMTSCGAIIDAGVNYNFGDKIMLCTYDSSGYELDRAYYESLNSGYWRKSGPHEILELADGSIIICGETRLTDADGSSPAAGSGSDFNGYLARVKAQVPIPDISPLPTINAFCSYTPPIPTASLCSGATVNATTTTSFPITSSGYTSVTWTYDDGLGNTSTQSQVIKLDLPQMLADTAMCAGDSIFLFGDWRYATGAYYDTLMASLGCDSIVRQILIVQSPSYDSTGLGVCYGIDYTFADGHIEYGIVDTNSYSSTLVSSWGCDSVVVETVYPLSAGAYTATGSGVISANISGMTYQWYDCVTGLPIVGETSETFEPTVAGSYYVSIDNGTCIDVSNCVDIILCPQLEVDISSTQYTACTDAYTFVQYCNQGFVDEYNAEVVVALPSDFVVSSCTQPYTINAAGEFVFDVDTLISGECGNIQFTHTIPCALGETRCVQAWMLPYNTCLYYSDTASISMWDDSSLEVQGVCQGDTALFTIVNIGTGNMTGATESRIYFDNALVYVGSVMRNAGEIDSLLINPYGQDIRVEADQRPGHPGDSRPRYTLEDCGTGTGGDPFINDVPLDEANLEIAWHCAVIIGPYDPNDKTAYPSGVTSQKYVQPNGMMEYLIRFQNVGTATAVDVRILDTISQYLDPETFSPGVATDSYEVNVISTSPYVVEFMFDSIMLADSTSDPLGSQGFVQYKIDQLDSLPNGTIIHNEAHIFFDFNPAIITNDAWVQIHDTVILDTAIVFVSGPTHVKEAGFELSLFPNPTNGNLTLNLLKGQVNHVDLLSGDGKLIQKWPFAPDQIMIKGETGLYFVRVYPKDGNPITFKIIKE